MTKRALKLPDGGTLDLPIPDGFGSPILAMNDANQSMLNGTTLRWISVGLGVAAVLLFWKATTLKVA
jgi:hypothetical protein